MSVSAANQSVSGSPHGRPRPLLDRVGDRTALAMLELFREAEFAERGPQRTHDMLEIFRELNRMSHPNSRR